MQHVRVNDGVQLIASVMAGRKARSAVFTPKVPAIDGLAVRK